MKFGSLNCLLFFRIGLVITQLQYLQNNQLNPVWNEHFEFIVEDPLTQHLTVRVFDDEGVQASELLGCAQSRTPDPATQGTHC